MERFDNLLQLYHKCNSMEINFLDKIFKKVCIKTVHLLYQ